MHKLTVCHLRCVEFLVGHGADLFIENHNGQTACDLAVACGHHQVIIVITILRS